MSPRRAIAPRVPQSLDELRGLRAATWRRESTQGQLDFYGLPAQRQLIDDAIERFELVDTGLGWTVAASGWKAVWLTPEWQQMLQAARDRKYDVLVVAYFSRFARNVKQALVAIEDELHAAGAAVLFCDERLLSSDDHQYHELVDEANDAEKYSRRMARRQREGHAAKRRRGEPGGRPPFGFRRDGRPPVLVEDPERMAVVRKAFQLAAQGLTDREVAARVKLRKTHVSEILVNKVYVGELRDGNRRTPVVDESLWDRVQALRSRHARRHLGPTTYRTYPLSALLRCRACGRRLIGHQGRYRHPEGCPAFRAARPGGSDARHLGDSYAARTYDGILPRVLARVRANAELLVDVQAAMGETTEPHVDEFQLARLQRERRRAMANLAEDRDIEAWQTAMERLDREEIEARAVTTSGPSPRDVVASLSDLARLFIDAEPQTQQRIAQALFEEIEVLGPSQVWVHPSLEAEARGWAAAMSGEFTLEERHSGRGERI